MPERLTTAALERLLARLDAIERAAGRGTLALPDGVALAVSNLGKVYFPEPGYTKGDLMRYYVHVARAILPAMADRPLALERYPNGLGGYVFFQQKAPAKPPPGIRTATVDTEGGRAARLVGGSLATLLYTVQLGTIEVHAWTARVRALARPDYLVLDLDPGPRAPFARTVDVARAVKEVLDTLGEPGALKTSGSRGLHIFVPLPPRATWARASRLAEEIATRTVALRPASATLERRLDRRPPDAVYVDHLQNARGKHVAATYSVRARAHATVSTPLHWDELTDDLDPLAFTIETVPERLAALGDIWSEALRGT